MKFNRLRRSKKGITGFGTIGNMILVLVLLGIILYIIYSLFWEKLIQGSLDPAVKETNTQSGKVSDNIKNIFGEPAKEGADANKQTS